MERSQERQKRKIYLDGQQETEKGRKEEE